MKTSCSLSFFISFFILSVFTTSCDKEVDPKLLPVLSTTEVIKMTEATAYSGGTITSDAGSNVVSRGVCWSESPNPTVDNSKTADAAGTGTFESRIVGLKPSTTYFVRAYAANKKGTAYGLQVTFTTKSLVITTTPITAVTISSAASGGTITTDGDSLNVAERGICWSTTANPTIANTKLANGKSKGTYICSLTQLQIATQYYVRAYATNSTGTYYGDELSFITTNGTMTLSTTDATSIKATSATIGGNVPDDGGAAVTERGLCISKLPNPTISNKIVNGSGIGAFATNITGLEANSTYYVRVFATNSVGTAYGNEISFTTKDGIIQLSTIEANTITTTTAKSGGNVTTDGGSTITTRGVCWSTNPNPTTANSKLNSTGSIGTFTSNLTGLNIGSTYYVRAFATNSFGTYYGNEIGFKTQEVVITLQTNNPKVITSISAVCSGSIVSDQGSTATQSGICWSKASNPTTNDNILKSIVINPIEQFKITNLEPNATYYVRAFATNIGGTYYGNQASFTTPNTVTDSDGNVYNTVIIGTQTWMTENLKTTKLNDGSTIPMVKEDVNWKSTTTPAYCWYNNDETMKQNRFGAIYNGYAVLSGKLAPTGWHIPTSTEWTNLCNFLGGKSIAGGKLKETSTWKAPNTGATNEYEFSALPGGERTINTGSFNRLYTNGNWWCSNSAINSSPFFNIYYSSLGSNTSTTSSSIAATIGFSVRCVKD